MDAEPGTWGVFAAEGPGEPLRAEPAGTSYVLDGRKHWCSLAGVLDRGLVSAWVGEERQLFAVDLTQPGVTAVSGTWVARGLAAVDSGPVDFDGRDGQRRGRAGVVPRASGLRLGRHRRGRRLVRRRRRDRATDAGRRPAAPAGPGGADAPRCRRRPAPRCPLRPRAGGLRPRRGRAHRRRRLAGRTPGPRGRGARRRGRAPPCRPRARARPAGHRRGARPPGRRPRALPAPVARRARPGRAGPGAPVPELSRW